MKSIPTLLSHKNFLRSVVWLCGVYLFFAFLPIPKPIETGLDPSWKYGISQLSENGAIFGKDVIFTYGSFGYLVRGAVIDGNFWDIFLFQIFVHILLFAVTALRMARSRHTIERIAVGLSIIFPCLIADVYQALQTEYKILYIIILLLSFREFWESQFARYFAIGIGAVGGFLLHSKVSLGLQASVSLFLFFAIRVFFRLRSQKGIRENLLLLLDSQLAAGTTAFLFLSGQTAVNFSKVFILLLTFLAIEFWLISKQQIPENANVRTNGIHPIRSRGDSRIASTLSENGIKLKGKLSAIAPFSTRIFYGLGLFGIILFSEPSLFAYLKGYSEITSGYSSAMSYIGSPVELGMALLEIALTLILLAVVARDKNAGFSAAMLLIILLTFKHGFVRQGAHVLRFFFSMPLILALCAVQIHPGGWRKFAYGVHLYGLILCLISYHHYSTLFPANYPPNILRPLAPALVFQKAEYLFDPTSLQAELREQSRANLQAVTLPNEVRNAIGNATIDIIPWEVSIVPANQLNWKFRPVFQSQAAYRTYLDFANRDDLAEEPRDFLLYHFHAVDGRHPFFAEPATAFYYTCHYQISPRVPTFVPLQKFANLMVLEPAARSRCGGETPGRTLSVGWNEWATLTPADGKMVRAAIAFEYSAIGKLAKLFFRVPPIQITVVDASGIERSYKILMGNADDGVWLSHLPKDDVEVFAFFQGQLPSRIDRFQFSTPNPSLFQPTIEVQLFGYDLGGFNAS